MSTKSHKTNENDFAALDSLARGITPQKLRPLTLRQQEQWEAARRGRPKKPPGAKSSPKIA